MYMQISVYLKGINLKYTVLAYLVQFMVIPSYRINYDCVISYNCDKKYYQ